MDADKTQSIKKLLLSPYFSITLVILSLVFRFLGLHFVSFDMKLNFLNWYEIITKSGLIAALKSNTFSYPPPYVILLGLVTQTRPYLEPVVGIKLIPMTFDIYCALLIYKIVKFKYPDTRVAWLAASLFFLLPTVILNSAFWGQSDSIYTAFLLTCLYFLLTRRPGWAIVFFGIAISIKLQAVFIAPFLVVLTWKKVIPWKPYGLIPLIYAVLMLPAALAGRPLGEILNIYQTQAAGTSQWSSNAANPYIFLSAIEQTHLFSHLVTFPPYVFPITLLVAAIIMGIWVILTVKRIEFEEPRQLLLVALASVSLLPFILPRMHDRYFYPADVFSLLFAFYSPELWILPLMFQISSFLVYDNYLFGFGVLNLPIAMAINTTALIILLRTQFSRPERVYKSI